jgi:copper(I)-binding protein
MRTLVRSIVAAVFLAVMAFGLSSGVRAQDPATPESMPMGEMDAMGGTGAAFMTIVNSSTEADRLIGAKTDVAETVEVHEVKTGDGGMMTMSPLADGLEIPAGATMVLEPGSYHLMLIGLKQDLTMGFSYELTLTFEKAGELTVTVIVQSIPPGASEGGSAYTAGQITITNPWSRPAPALSAADQAPMAMAAGFMTILNTGTEADRLVAAKTDVAMTVEIHEVVEGDGGVMQMQPLADGLEIPAGETVVLEPGSYHLMLIGIKQDFTLGFSYELTLTFEKAGDVTITVPVLAAAPSTSEGGPAIKVGQITVSNQWSRPAPAMQGETGADNGHGNMGEDHGHMGEATPEAGM